MSSINTNLSAMTALQSLKATQNAMNKNQNQISTGLRVGEASHNASYWSISTQMKSDNGALSAVKDSIKQSKAMINTFTSAMDKTLTYLNKMKAGLVTAAQPGADLAKIQDRVQGQHRRHEERCRLGVIQWPELAYDWALPRTVSTSSLRMMVPPIRSECWRSTPPTLDSSLTRLLRLQALACSATSSLINLTAPARLQHRVDDRIWDAVDTADRPL